MRRMVFNADELENVNVIIGTFDFETEKLEHVSQDENYKKIINQIKKSQYNSENYPIFIVDNAFGTTFTGILNGLNIDIYSLGPNTIYNVTMVYNPNADTLDITLTEEVLISEDNVKTIFGQGITGTGDITMYRHQITIRFDTDTKEVNYVVYSSSKTQITNYDDFIAVAKPISNFNYPAIYENSNNAEPAFIRFASGTILVGLSTGMEPYTSVADNVSPL